MSTAIILRLTLTLCTANTIFLVMAIVSFIIGRRILLSSKSILKTGIAPKGSGFGGLPEKDIKTHKGIGCLFLYLAICWYLASVIFVYSIFVFTIIVVYLTNIALSQ